MKAIIFKPRTLLLLLFVSFESYSLGLTDSSNNDNEIVKSFEQVTEKINNFYNSNPIFLDEQPLSSSPTKKVFHLYKHQSSINISYDIKKTESLVSPCMGYIEVTISDIWINTELITDSKGKVTQGLFRLEDCLADTIFHKYKAKGVVKIKYYYTYQKEEWVFKDIEAFKNNIYDDDWGKDENKHWVLAAISVGTK